MFYKKIFSKFRPVIKENICGGHTLKERFSATACD